MKWLHEWLAEFIAGLLLAGVGFFFKLNNRVTALEDIEDKLGSHGQRIERLEAKVQTHEIMLNTVESLHQELKTCLPQIGELSNLSTRLEAILTGMDRRLQLVENELIENRKR